MLLDALRDFELHATDEEFVAFTTDQARQGREYGRTLVRCPGCCRQQAIRGIANHLMDTDGWTMAQVGAAIPF